MVGLFKLRNSRPSGLPLVVIGATQISVLFFKYGPFPASFWILFFFLGSLFILQLTNIDNNGDKKQEIRVKSMQHSIPHSFRKSQAPSENRLAAILNRKNPSPSRESNPACSDRMPLPSLIT